MYSLWFNFAHITVETKRKILYMEVTQKLEVQITKEYKDRLYGKKLIPLPRPKFVVFYNGLEDQPGPR